MAKILNIDTSSKFCSVSLAENGETVIGYESSNEMDHSTSLAPFVDKIMNYLREKGEKLEAVSVANGPGSYTGLRIGLSLAKGIAYSLNIPLITLDTLEIIATRGMFSYQEIEGDEIIITLMDAGRMEVYAGAFDCGLKRLFPSQPVILDETKFMEFSSRRKIIFIGDGTEKFKSVYKGRNSVWLGEKLPHAKYMAPLSEKYFRENKFSDIAYSTPQYLKEYQTTKSKKRL